MGGSIAAVIQACALGNCSFILAQCEVSVFYIFFTVISGYIAFGGMPSQGINFWQSQNVTRPSSPPDVWATAQSLVFNASWTHSIANVKIPGSLRVKGG